MKYMLIAWAAYAVLGALLLFAIYLAGGFKGLS